MKKGRMESTGSRERERERGKKSIVAPSITIRYWLDFGPVSGGVFAITPDK